MTRRFPKLSPNVFPALSGVAALSAGLLSVTSAQAADLATIRLTAERSVLKADGRSYTVISAEVRDEQGRVVPDGTLVRFATTAGRLDTQVASTRSGVARVLLTASDLPDTAIVTANLDDVGRAIEARRVITFTADAGTAETGTNWLRIDGRDYVGYSVQDGIVQANGKGGKAKVSYRGVTVTADALQYNQNENTLVAKGDVTITSGKEKRRYTNLKLEFGSLSGDAEKDVDGRLVPVKVKGPRLKETEVILRSSDIPVEEIDKEATHQVGTVSGAEHTEPYTEPELPETLPEPTETPAEAGEATPATPETTEVKDAPPATVEKPAEPITEEGGEAQSSKWEFVDLSESSVIVTAKSIALEPGSTIQFRRASFYFDGVKTVSLPFHVMNLGQDTLFDQQVLGYGPQGVTVDFPLYYNVSPNSVGTAHIRRGERVGSSAYSTRPGWSVDLEQSYNGREGSEGTVELLGATRRDWGGRYRHSQRFGESTQGNLFVEFPNHRDVFTSSQVSRSFKDFSVSLAASGSYAPDSVNYKTGEKVAGGDLRGQVFLETNPHSVASSPLKYSVNVSTARQAFYGASASSRSLINTHSSTLRMFTTPLRMGPRTNLTQSLSLGQTWIDTKGSGYGMPGTGSTIYATSSINQSLGKLGSVRVNYDYSQTPLTVGIQNSLTGRHRASATAYLSDGQKWNLNVTASKMLDRPNATLISSLQVSLGGPYQARATYSSSRFEGYKNQEMEYALVRRIGGRDVALYYSTTSKQFSLDLTGARF